MLRWKRIIPVAVLTLWPLAAQADILSSPHFRIDTDAATTFGGFGSSTNYRLTDAGGEAAVGAGSSNSYKLTSGYVATLAQNIQLNVQPNGLVAYYPFDTGTNNVAYDVSANNNVGVLNNTGTWTASSKVGPNAVWFFDGTSQDMTVPHSAALSITGDLTIEGWVKVAASGDFGNSPVLIAKGADQEYQLGFTASRRLKFNSSAGTFTGTNPIGINVFAHVAVTRSAGTLRLYINGVQDSTTSMASSAGGTDPVTVGSRTSSTNFLKGQVDELKVFNRLLSASEIKAEYDAQNAGVASGIAIPTVTPGVSQTALIDAVVRTDAAGYDLGIQQNHDLLHTDTTTTISPVSGSIASPIAWSEGSTKGLGFTLNAVTGSGNAIEGSWTGGTMFGAIPGSATTFHGRTGFTGGTPERNTVQLRLDVPTSQKSGAYSSTLTYTATLKP